MTAYVIVDLTPQNTEALAAYSAAAAATIETYGGRIAAKGTPTVLKGWQSFEAKAVIEFPSSQQAASWFNSPEYQALTATRDKGMDSQFHLVG